MNGGNIIHVWREKSVPGARDAPTACERGWKRLTASVHGKNGREGVHYQCEAGPEEKNDVAKQTDWSHPEGTVGDVVAAAEEETDDGDRVGDVEANDTGGDHAGWVDIG